MKIFYGTSNVSLSKRVLDLLSARSSDSEFLKIEKFSDGEILPRFTTSIRDEDIYFIQSTESSDSIMETLLVCDAAKRAGAKSFTLIAPFQGYSRQDKTDHIRSSIGSKVVADILEKVGMTRLMTIDLHANSIQGFYNTTVIHLNGNLLFIDYFKSLGLENVVVCSPDHGALKRNRDFAAAFPDATLAVINKRRIKPNEIHSMELIGDVTGKNVILVDDMADTCGTLCKASELLHNHGALSIRAVATHGVLSGSALDNIESSRLTEMVVSDSLGSVNDKIKEWNQKNEKRSRLKVISCAPLIADAIKRIQKNKSIHEMNSINL